MISPTSISEEKVGLALVILMDRSGSMKEPGITAGQARMDTQRAVVSQLIDLLVLPFDSVQSLFFP